MKSWGVGTVEYQLLPYNPGFSMVAVDPDKKHGLVIVDFLGFQKDVIKRMHIKMTKQQSHYWFEYWVNQFNDMWQVAKLLQSPPTTGNP